MRNCLEVREFVSIQQVGPLTESPAVVGFKKGERKKKKKRRMNLESAFGHQWPSKGFTAQEQVKVKGSDEAHQRDISRMGCECGVCKAGGVGGVKITIAAYTVSPSGMTLWFC